MPLPPSGRKKVKPNKHLFMAKLQSCINKVNVLLEQIFDIANCDLIVTDANKGIMDYELNRKFAKKLNKLSKEFASMSGRISDVSSLISDKVDAALDRKDIKQGIVFWDEITDSKQNCWSEDPPSDQVWNAVEDKNGTYREYNWWWSCWNFPWWDWRTFCIP